MLSSQFDMNSDQSNPATNTFPIVHLVRHGPIADHEADRSLTVEGRKKALDTGRALAAQIRRGETITFFSSPARRTRQTAAWLRDGLVEAVSEMDLVAAVVPITAIDDRLQNLQLYLDGLSYDPMRPLFEVVRWRSQQTPSPQYEAYVAFHTGFWNSSDQLGYWLTHPSSAVEAPEAVAGRTQAFIAGRLAEATERNGLYRDICVTHAANLRAFLWLVFGSDPGEPPFCGMVTVTAGQVYYQGQVASFRATASR